MMYICILVILESLCHGKGLYLLPKLLKPLEKFCSVLPAAHAITGRGTTSIFKLGKRTAYTILLKHGDTLKPLTKFHSPDVDAGLEARTVDVRERYET